MAYKLYDKDGQPLEKKDLQDRSKWYEHGVKKENIFVRCFGEKLGVAINPGKKDDDKVPDLIVFNTDGSKGLGDLKTQNTPFFYATKISKAERLDPLLYPGRTVTFNVKDALNYKNYLERSGTDLTVFFWVDWIAVKMVMDERPSRGVQPLHGIWKTKYSELEKIRPKLLFHWYNERPRKAENDHAESERLLKFEPRLEKDGIVHSVLSEADDNAACSYLISLDQLEEVIILD